MKVLAVVVLVFGAASAGSGPYLPSGWKPSGPAFYLPGEVQSTSENPLKDDLQVEPAGSDSLREYGPPDVVEPSQEQRLPEVTTEQAFLVVNTQESREATKENLEQIIVTEDTTTEQIQESDDVTEPATVDVTEAVDTAVQMVNNYESVTEDQVVNEIESITEVSGIDQENVVDVDDAEVKSVAVDLPEVTENDGEPQNIAEALAKLEDEIKEIQVEELKEAPKSLEIEKVQPGVVGAQVPEGFLEYGPPGFSEYGPPKEKAVPLTEVLAQTNDARRRRFSPKFRTVTGSQQH